MKLTLLQVCQKYLDRTSGFYVNSIFETDESQQIASIAEDIYYEMTQAYPNLLFTQKERTLDAVSDPTRPNFLKIPDEIQSIQESQLWYNVAKDTSNATVSFLPVGYLTPLEFLNRFSRGSDSAANTIVVENFEGAKMVVRTNKAPSYFTSFDGVYITTDSYNAEEDSSLQASKTKVVSTEMPVFLQEDDFVIPIPERLTQGYLNMVLDQCYNDIRQERNALISQKARAFKIRMQQDSRQVGSGGRAKTKYGRQGRSYQYERRYFTE